MSLCLACGLCCDGSLFAVAAITPREARRLEGRVELTGNGQRVRLPCRALRGDKTCAVYEDRPHACRAFRCRVLVQLEAGALSNDAAHAEIARVLEPRREVARLIGLSDAGAAMKEARARIDAKTASPELELAWACWLELAATLPFEPD